MTRGRLSIGAGVVAAAVVALVVGALLKTTDRAATTESDGVAAVAGAGDSAPGSVSGRTRAESAAIPAGTQLLVVVRGPDGAPIGDASVAVSGLVPSDDPRDFHAYAPDEDAKPVATTRTDADGRACVAGLHTGRWLVVVEAPGFARAETAATWVEGDSSSQVVVTLERANTLEVAVSDSEGRPVAGVAIRIGAHGRPGGDVAWDRVWRATTDADGTCRVGGLPRRTFVAWCEGGDRDEFVAVRVPDVTRVELRAPESAEEKARATTTLEVRAVDAYGGPVAGAGVRFVSGKQPFGSLTAEGTTGADGVCRVQVVGNSLANVEVIEARRAGFATARVGMDLVQVWAGETRRFDDVVLRPEASVTGRVIGPEGPVANATVAVWVAVPSHFGKMEPEETTTDAAGVYRVGGLAAGTVVVVADGPGLDPVGADKYGSIVGSFGPESRDLDGISDSVKVTLVEGGEATLDLKMLRTGPAVPLRVVFTGMVRHEDGTPAAGAEVWADGATDHCWVYDAGRTFSGSGGRFRLEASAGSGFGLYATATGVKSERVEVEMSESGARDGVELVLKRKPVVRGAVKSAIGLPVAGARVRIGHHHFHKFDAEGTHWNDDPESAVADDGSFAAPIDLGPWGGSDRDMPADDFVVCIEADGHAPKVSAPFTVDDVKAGKSIELIVDAGVSIEGRVVGDDGTPVADASVTLVTPDQDYNGDNWPPQCPPMPSETLVARTAADGSFRIERLAVAQYVVRVAARGTVGASADATPPAKLVLRARAALEIAGRVVSSDGAVVESRVSIEPGEGQADGPGDSSTTPGEFRFRGVASGTWRLTVEPMDEALAPVVVPSVVAGASAMRVEVKPGLRIAGTLVDADGKPLADVGIRGRRLSGGPCAEREAKAGADGAFALMGLLSGAHEIEAEELGLRWPSIDAGAKPVLRVPGALTIRGVVRLPATDVDGRPRSTRGAGYADVRARRAGTDVEHMCSADEEGVFVLGHLAAGRYEISVDYGMQVNDASFVGSIPPGTVLDAGAEGVVLDLEVRPVPPTERR